ncbi:hypothetical protein BDW72DRAFT_165870 [Aspergillus terricola var. indicus]
MCRRSSVCRALPQVWDQDQQDRPQKHQHDLGLRARLGSHAVLTYLMCLGRGRSRKPLTPLAVSYHLVDVIALSIIHIMMGDWMLDSQVQRLIRGSSICHT